MTATRIVCFAWAPLSRSLVDLGDQGASLGDEIVFSGKLLKGENKVAHQGTVCMAVSLQRQEAQCIATYSFRAGQITGRAWLPWFGGADDVAITGGFGTTRRGGRDTRSPCVGNGGEIDFPPGGLTGQPQ
jgi:hypothetical protein